MMFLNLSAFADFWTDDTKIVISHAGGSIEGKKYLSSLEAVQSSIKKGFKFIELDLLETSDGDLVAAHDWKTFHKITGYPAQNNAISSKEVKGRKIFKNQTVLTSSEIKEIFMQNPELFLVTDKIRNINIIKEKFSTFLDRVIVEFKFPKECKRGIDEGLSKCAFLFKFLPIDDNVDEKYTAVITIPLRKLDEYKERLLKQSSVKVLVYTVNDDTVAREILNLPFVKGIYTDTLPPNFMDNKNENF